MLGRQCLFALGVLACFLGLSCGSDDPASDEAGAVSGEPATMTAPKAEEPVAEDEAFWRPGVADPGVNVLPTGRLVTPAGDLVGVASFPMDVAVSPDGATAVVSTARKPTVHVIDVATGTVREYQNIPHAFSGLMFHPDGDRFFLSGGASHKIHEFTLAGGLITQERIFSVDNMPSGLALSPDGLTLYAACYMGKRLAEIDLASGLETASYPVHLFPYDVVLSNSGRYAFVSNHGADSVSVLDLNAGGAEIETVPVGVHPEMMAMSPDGTRLYVANADSDDVSVIDTASYNTVDVYPLHLTPDDRTGASPVAVEVSADGSRLYVTSSSLNSVDILNAATGDVLGRLPTGWYPTNACLDEANGRLFVTNGKGVGSAGLGLYDQWQGSLSIIDLPTAPELADYTIQVEDNARFSQTFFDLSGDIASPIPTEEGTPSEVIKHVIFILRENKLSIRFSASWKAWRPIRAC
ncbi:MAG: YncE family protein [Deltaproteobacteria bacterium]|nr:YncE family protein [Deltaproteobacteria bacterium]